MAGGVWANLDVAYQRYPDLRYGMRGQGIGRQIASLRRGVRPARLGSFGSTSPFAAHWGYDRGLPVDRWYIEHFLDGHRDDITGRVAEIKDSTYTRRFGHSVTEHAVVDIDPANPHVTRVADLGTGEGLGSDEFDCFIITQTLQFIYDLPAATRVLHRALRPGGVLLATLPVAGRIEETAPQRDLWRFTPVGVERLLSTVFGEEAVSVAGHGNVLAQVAFLQGLAAQDLTQRDLAINDPRFPLVVTARAVKAR